MPYIGTGLNEHIRPYPDIKSELNNEVTDKTFSFVVKEKGNKQRTVQVNIDAWAAICEFYLPLYYERRKKFETKYPEKNSNKYFFLKKNGDPVTAKNIADQTYHAKKRILKDTGIPFPWTFHSSRDWYATNFIILHLSNNQIDNLYYNAAVDDQLRKQLGHNDIKTIYMHYVRQASLVLALQAGKLDLTLGRDKSFFKSLI